MLIDNPWSKQDFLLSNVCGGSIAGAGLDTQHRGWRIRHPRTANDTRDNKPDSIQTGLVRLNSTCLGEMDREPSGMTAKPPLRLLVSALSCGCSIRPESQRHGVLPTMIYSFLIAPQSLRVAELNRIRIVSCYARNLKQARASFAGLSVALLSRKPAGGSANA